jgi:hypothetical protein
MILINTNNNTNTIYTIHYTISYYSIRHQSIRDLGATNTINTTNTNTIYTTNTNTILYTGISLYETSVLLMTFREMVNADRTVVATMHQVNRRRMCGMFV